MFITASFKHVLGKGGKNQILKLVRDPSSAGRFYYIYYKRIRGDFIAPQTYTIKSKEISRTQSSLCKLCSRKSKRHLQ